MKRVIAATVLAIAFVGGAAATASAETPMGGHSQCPKGKGGYDCKVDTGPGKHEFDCYKNAGGGAAPGALVGSAPGAAAGAAVGCIKGATGN